MHERTLVILKPDALRRSLVGKIVIYFEEAGLKIDAMQLKLITHKEADAHYGDLNMRKGEQVKKSAVEYLTDGTSIIMILSGANAVEKVRKICGDTDPLKADPGTIRFRFASTSVQHANSLNLPVMNLIHSSATEEEAEMEIKNLFY